MTIPTNWLENSDYPKCIVAIFDYYTDSVNTMYLSTHKKIATYNGIEMCFNPRLYGDISFNIGLADSDKGVRTTVSLGQLKVINSDGALDNWLDLGVDGRPLQLFILPSESNNIDTDGVLLFKGVIDKLEISDNNTLALTFKDPLLLLDVPIQPTLYVDGELVNYTINGTLKTIALAADLKNKPKPIVYGQVFNIEPILLSATSKVYQVDPTPIQAITEVYDRGVALGLGIGYNVDLSKGIIELVNNTSGTITCDVLGRRITLGAYSDSVSEIFKNILVNKSVYPIYINLDNSIKVATGIYITERENTLDVLDQLASSFDGFYGFDALGIFRVSCLTIPNTTEPLHIICEKGSKYGDVITDGTDNYILASDSVGTPDYSSISTIADTTLITQFNAPYILGESDILGDITISSTNNINYRVKIQHTKNYTVQTDIASSVSAARKEFISNEYRQVILDNSGILTKHIRATEKEPYDTLLVSTTAAAILANRFVAKNSRYVFEVKFKAVASKLLNATIGSVIKLFDYRYGLDNGVLCTIRQIDINYLYGTADIVAIFSRVPNQAGTFNFGLTDTAVSPSTTITIPAAHSIGRRYFSLDKVIGTNSHTDITIESIVPDIDDPIVRVEQGAGSMFNVSVNGGAVFNISSAYDIVFLVDFDAKTLALYSNNVFHSNYYIPDTGYRRILVDNNDIADDSTIKFSQVSLPIADIKPWGILEVKKEFNYEV